MYPMTCTNTAPVKDLPRARVTVISTERLLYASEGTGLGREFKTEMRAALYCPDEL
jgi:hypothetical protein